MAAHYDEPFLDLSGYTPSLDKIAELKRQLCLHHARYLPGAAWIDDCPQSLNPQGAVLEAVTERILQLSLADLKEIEDAYAYFVATGLSLNELQAEQFPLPSLAVRLRQRAALLPDQEPYFIIRGLKPQWFSKYKNVVIYTGIASHIGTKRAWATGDPNVLHHITNLKAADEEIYRGPANRNIALPFHTDYGSILSFYMLSKAQTGGDLYLADIHDIVCEISKTRPDILQTLRQSFVNINAREDGAYDERPLLFTLSSGALAVQASRSRLFGTACRPRPASLPRLTPAQIEAIDALHVAGQLVATRFPSQSGDMIFFNNLRMMHARDAFVDGAFEENNTTRYLLRLILHDDRKDGQWEVPAQLESTWEELYHHDDKQEVFAIHPELFSYKAAH